eukprot:805125-Prorocentrum_minimum.AAC.4
MIPINRTGEFSRRVEQNQSSAYFPVKRACCYRTTRWTLRTTRWTLRTTRWTLRTTRWTLPTPAGVRRRRRAAPPPPGGAAGLPRGVRPAG